MLKIHPTRSSLSVRTRPLAAMLLSVLGLLGLTAQAMAQPTFGPPRGRDRDRVVDAPGASFVDWQELDPERKEPTSSATPGVYFAAKTTQGLRYAWSLPVGFKPGESYDAIVLLHPDRMTFRWGVSTHPRGGSGLTFRPDDILISIDAMGVSPRGGDDRFFDVKPENMVRFRDAILEVTRKLPVRRIFLYGQQAGGRFAVNFAARFPALGDGVVCHGADLREQEPFALDTPIVFMHGDRDASVPILSSIEGLHAFEQAENRSVRLRVLRRYNDFPNPVRASEAIDYLKAMRSSDPKDSLQAVRSMLAPKPVDEFGYRTSVWYTGAVLALKHIRDDRTEYTLPITEEQKAEADALAAAIDAHAAKHIAELRTLLVVQPTLTSLALDGRPWLGYLLSFYSDFQEVPAAEAFFSEIKLREQMASQDEAFGAAMKVWNESASEAEQFEETAEHLPGAFLRSGWPPGVIARMKACMRKADQLKLPQAARDRFELVELWDTALREGAEAYARTDFGWTLPVAGAKP